MKKIAFLTLCLVAAACSQRSENLPLASEEKFSADVDGAPVAIYTLRSPEIVIQVTNFGGRVVNLFTKDRAGKWENIVLGHDNVQDYITPPGERFFGATVGPVANRIGKATYELDGQVWKTDPNDNGVNTLHGGFNAVDMKVWEVKSADEKAIELGLVCPDGDGGFPGNLDVTMRYELDGNDFIVTIDATTDKATPVNFTHHPFFCLNGERGGSAEDYYFTLKASNYLPIDALSIPTGEIAPVEGTPFDFRTRERIGARIGDDNEQLRNARGYDHNWCLDRETPDQVESACLLEDVVSGRKVEVLTNRPGMQVYTGNFFEGEDYRASIALEAQDWPDAVNQPAFPSIILRPGEKYHHVTVYRFGVSE